MSEASDKPRSLTLAEKLDILSATKDQETFWRRYNRIIAEHDEELAAGIIDDEPRRKHQC